MPEFQTRYAGLVGLKQAYGVKNVKFVPLAGISVYEALSTPTSARSATSSRPIRRSRATKYTVLTDPKYIFGFQNVVPVVTKQAGDGARLEVPRDDGRGQREADPGGDDRDEQGGRDRQEVAARGRLGLPEGERPEVGVSAAGRGPR